MEEYIKKLLESPGSTGIGGGAKAGTGDLPFRTSAKNGSIEHGNGLQVGKGKGTKGSVTAECDKQQLQRKEEQRKEYERQEALRKQQATEKVLLHPPFTLMTFMALSPLLIKDLANIL